MKTIIKEKKLLLISVFGALFAAFMGIVFGIIASSQIIMFDGLYSLLSVGLTYTSILAAKFISKNDWDRYPFGKASLEPLVVFFKYLVILGLVLGSFFSSVMSLFDGGRTININIGLLYSIINTSFCYILYQYFKNQSKKIFSGFLSAEVNQWLMDTYTSLGVLISFIIAIGFKKLPNLNFIIPYIDPIVVIIVCILFVKVPILEIKSAINEILSIAPEGKLSKDIESILSEIEQKYLLDESFLRVAKGRKILWIEIDFVVSKDSKIKTIKDQDIVREEISKKLKFLGYDKWLTVSFTSDRKWAL